MDTSWNSVTRRLLAAIGFALLSVPAVRADVITLQGTLDAAQVVDGGGSTSTGTGSATLIIDTTAETMTLDFSWSGLSGPVDRAHLHDAPAGVSRLVFDPFDAFFDEVFFSDNPLRTIDCSAWSLFDLCVPAAGTLHFVQGFADIIDLSPSCDPAGEVCSVDTLVNMALNDIIYIDMHTQLFPSGELRGQLIPLAVPEPDGLALLACGLLVAAWHGRARLVRRRS